MGLSFFFLVFCLGILPLASSEYYALNEGSSLSVEKSGDVLVSPNRLFSAGFFPVGDNAYCFAIWFNHSNSTVAWMANREQPVNGRRSKLSLDNGNLVLTDAGQTIVWTTDLVSTFSVQLKILDSGNLVLRTLGGHTLWQSFDSPTDTLLPHQLLTRNTQLVSSRSPGNYSSGFYKLYFDNDNVLRLLYNGPNISSVYWPAPWLLSWQAGRTTYNDSRTASFNSLGYFISSDNFQFNASDAGAEQLRRLTIESDGNLRMYSLANRTTGAWSVSWQAISQPCTIHGVCGPNSLCTYDHGSGRKCSCLPGYKMITPADWAYGCGPNFELSDNLSEVGFFQLLHVDFYGYDLSYTQNFTWDQCAMQCMQSSDCSAFQYKLYEDTGVHACYTKFLLKNGQQTPNFMGDVYLKLPKASMSSYEDPTKDSSWNCSSEAHEQLARIYRKRQENEILSSLLWFASALGGFEVICVISVWFFLFRDQKKSVADQGYHLAATGFKRFTYAEIQKATSNFITEIGRGGGGIVYKGVLSDKRIAAIKQLNEANQGDAQFLAEVMTIGKLNHMNLIDMWGYCVEGKHRLLIYEYAEHGSLADNLSANVLDWDKRFQIAVGTARGLAYLHEECLEWVLHCDVKPQNILLDNGYQPKVADFGLSKLLDRKSINSNFSMVRGTRGYMAPEWVLNLPITSKVDVYSYGIVILELITGKSPRGFLTSNGGETEEKSLVTWVREKRNNEVSTKTSCLEDIVDPTMNGQYDINKMEILVAVAMQCVEEDRDARPTMSRVVQMLLHEENDF
ncbi:S-locus glycoprotein domain [Dillenia turbinata]|uniref:Receptor-like serine/threonine-protein kinase n=1 Tax=Dillenia turbinata TaxID=194707 RepID=A0AAN8ZJ71_9MAGN